jgi:hypothetical protein
MATLLTLHLGIFLPSTRHNASIPHPITTWASHRCSSNLPPLPPSTLPPPSTTHTNNITYSHHRHHHITSLHTLPPPLMLLSNRLHHFPPPFSSRSLFPSPLPPPNTSQSGLPASTLPPLSVAIRMTTTTTVKAIQPSERERLRRSFGRRLGTSSSSSSTFHRGTSRTSGRWLTAVGHPPRPVLSGVRSQPLTAPSNSV